MLVISVSKREKSKLVCFDVMINIVSDCTNVVKI